MWRTVYGLEKDRADAPEKSGEGRMALSEETGRLVLAQLRRQCRALRIPREDREDLVQDVAIWIGLHRTADRPVSPSWLWSTLRRFARAVGRPRRREVPLEELPDHREPTRPPRRVSASIDELRRRLGESERRVVDLLLEGHTWPSALDRLGVSAGSRSRWRSRIRRATRSAMEGIRGR